MHAAIMSSSAAPQFATPRPSPKKSPTSRSTIANPPASCDTLSPLPRASRAKGSERPLRTGIRSPVRLFTTASPAASLRYFRAHACGSFVAPRSRTSTARATAERISPTAAASSFTFSLAKATKSTASSTSRPTSGSTCRNRIGVIGVPSSRRGPKTGRSTTSSPDRAASLDAAHRSAELASAGPSLRRARPFAPAFTFGRAEVRSFFAAISSFPSWWCPALGVGLPGASSFRGYATKGAPRSTSTHATSAASAGLTTRPAGGRRRSGRQVRHARGVAHPLSRPQPRPRRPRRAARRR